MHAEIKWKYKWSIDQCSMYKLKMGPKCGLYAGQCKLPQILILPVNQFSATRWCTAVDQEIASSLKGLRTAREIRTAVALSPLLCECITLPSARGAFCIVWADKWLKVPLPPALCHTDNTQPYCAIVLWGRSGFVWTPTMDELAAGNPLIVIAGRSLSEIARASNLKGKLWHYFFTKFASFPQGEKDYSNTHYSEFI